MKKTITGTMIAKAVSILGIVCTLGLLIAKIFGLIEIDTTVLLLLLLVNISTISLAFSRKK